MTPLGPPTPPWPTYAMRTVDGRGWRYPSYHRRDKSRDATRAPTYCAPTVATSTPDVKVIEDVPLSLTQGGLPV